MLQGIESLCANVLTICQNGKRQNSIPKIPFLSFTDMKATLMQFHASP